jgi:hypothetical protein
MNPQILLSKQSSSDIMWNQVYIRLDQLRIKIVGNQERYIPWSYIYQNICRIFTLKKEDCRALMYFLSKKGEVEISCKGVKLNFKIKYGP